MALLESETQALAARTSPVDAPVVDRFGRRFRYLRLSVTDRCNLSCRYCNPVSACATNREKLSWDELDFLVDVAVNDLGIEALRITGGEPTVRPGLVDWIARVRRHAGLRDVAMTTNGVMLAAMAPALRAAGLDRVNVSLDTWDAARFAEVTRGGSLARVLEGLDVARRTFARTKINCVALRGVVERELRRFVEYADAHDIEVRFIELMPIFDEKAYFHAHFIGVDELQARLADEGFRLVPDDDSGPAAGNRTGYGPASTFRVEGTRARLGFIAQMSATKCLTCNKLRLTSDGALKACLLMPEEVPLAAAIASRDRTSVARAMRTAFVTRGERYDAATILEQPVGRTMQATGG